MFTLVLIFFLNYWTVGGVISQNHWDYDYDIHLQCNVLVIATDIFHPVCPGKGGQDSPHRKDEAESKR